MGRVSRRASPAGPAWAPLSPMTDIRASFPSGRASAGRASVGGASVGPEAGWWAHVRWFVNGLTGQNAYQAYLAHHARTGCAAPPMSEREYWRQRNDWQDRNPQGRCC